MTMSDLPYAEPDVVKYNERLQHVLNASRSIDEFCYRTRRGLALHPETYLMQGLSTGLNRYSPYPIYRVDEVTTGDNDTATTDYELHGERNTIITLDTSEQNVKVNGIFGYGRLQNVGTIADGRAIGPSDTTLNSADFVLDAPAFANGRIFLIEQELMYVDGTDLVRGANGTTAALHGDGGEDADTVVYRVILPSIIQEAALVISQQLEALRSMARDADPPAPGGGITGDDLRNAMRNEKIFAQFEPSLKRYRRREPMIGWA